MALFKRIAKGIPDLAVKLRRAGMRDTPEQFVKKIVFISFFYTTILTFFLLFLFLNSRSGLLLVGFIIPISFFIIFFYFIKFPDIKIKRMERAMDAEVIAIGRFILVEIVSGVALFNALESVGNNFQGSGKFFRTVTEKIRVGTDIEAALGQAVEDCPSKFMRRILWQMMNSLQTGSDVAHSLSATIEQIAKEQMIDVKEYGRKLNPIAMMYMLMAVILPSLGVSMLIVLSTLVNITLTLPILLALAVAIGIVQYFFIVTVRSSRPAVEI